MDGVITKSRYIRLDPRSKMLLLLIVSISIMVGESSNKNQILKYLLIIVPLILLVLEKHIKGALIFGISYLLISHANLLLVYVSTTSILGVSIRLIMGLIGGMGPCIVMGYYLISSTKINEFIAAMERMHVSQNIIIPFTVMFRFFPTIKEEYHSINDAMRMRGIKYRYNLVAMLEYRLVPLIISTVKIGNDLSAAAMTRGLGSEIKRTNVCKIGFGIWDIAFVVWTIGVSALYAVL